MRKEKVFRTFVVIIITLSIPISIFLISQKSTFFNRAYYTLIGSKANLVINLTDSSPFTPSWKYLAQGGEERGAMLESVVEKIDRLEAEYVRIDHIYDFYQPVKKGSDGSLAFDWTNLDKEIETIQRAGAKPFISLSYMPPAISSGSEVDLPASWNQWSHVVEKTVEHISGRRGLAIDDVYYEVWNEPDLFGGFKLTGKKNYLTLYYFAERGAQSAKNVLPFKIGGPATTALYKNWFNSFFSYAQKSNLRVDFYSWHRYSRRINDYEDDITNAWQWILNYPRYSNTEFIITESGHDSEIDSGYDSNFAAIHTLSMFASTFQKIPKLFVFEIKDGPGPEKNWGRWGILTHQNYGQPEPKPRYWAIDFLNSMNGSWFPIYGQGSWVKAFATTDGEVIRVLIVNFDPYGKHIENVPVSFINIPTRTFIFRRRNFLGSTIDEDVNLTENNWSTQVLMLPNSAAIFEIVPKL